MELDFLGCPLADKDNYRETIFNTFKELMILDNCDREGNEIEVDDEEEEDEDIENSEESLSEYEEEERERERER